MMQENQHLSQDSGEHRIRGRRLLGPHESRALVLIQALEAREWSQFYGWPGPGHGIIRAQDGCGWQSQQTT